MEDNRRTYAYKTYKQYIAVQRGRSLRTKAQTGRYGWYRNRIAEQLRELCPAARTMLCVGARSDLEVQDFSDKGFEAEGIDLFSSERIVKCDMARIDRHPHFVGRTFDVFVAVHSIEHCLDFAGFVRCLAMCNTAIACVTPQITAPTSWDCSAFSFAMPGAEPYTIEQAFPGFRVAWSEVVKKTLLFVALRNHPGIE